MRRRCGEDEAATQQRCGGVSATRGRTRGLRTRQERDLRPKT
jgi:hypothetical protein